MSSISKKPEFLIPFIIAESGPRHVGIFDQNGRVYTYLATQSKERADLLCQLLTEHFRKEYGLPCFIEENVENEGWVYFYETEGGGSYPKLANDPYVLVMDTFGVISEDTRPISYFHNDGKDGNEFAYDYGHNRKVAYLIIEENPDAQDENGEPIT